MGNKKTVYKKSKPKKVNPYAKPQKKSVWPTVLIILLCCAVLGGAAYLIWGRGGAQPAAAPGAAANADPKGTHFIAIDVENYGTITAELYRDIAPVTVDNFVKLVNEGFYNGLTFHRIISGFMIQGGDPLGTGMGGSEQTIKGEFSLNGVANSLKHTRGVLSMARSMAYDSASSQFFIMHGDAPSLDGGYAAFGMVLTGMEVVDAICRDTPVTDDNGTVLKQNQPVITAIRMIEGPEG